MHAAPLVLQTSYADLVQQLFTLREPAGSLYWRIIKGVSYAYVKRTIGDARIDVFLGRGNDPNVIKKTEEIRAENMRARERRTVIAALKSYGFASPSRKLGSVLEVIADAGLFRNSVLVGTAAYQCYSPLLGAVLPQAHVMTLDADLATAELALTADGEKQSMEFLLRRADQSFTAIPGLRRGALPSSFRSRDGFIVDLLTPIYRRNDINPMPLANLAAAATPLQHLGWLIAEPARAAVLYKSGIAVRIPQPARYAVHKLIVAQKRKGDAIKRSKDLQQAGELIRILKEIAPWQLSDAYEDAAGRGRRGWQEPIHRSLRELGLAPKDLRAG